MSWFRSRRRGQAFDPGLQAERTSMAWQRTALGVGGTSALLVHVADRDLLAAIPGVAGLAAALALLLVGERRYAWTLSRLKAQRSPLDHVLVRITATTAVALACCAVAVLVLAGI